MVRERGCGVVMEGDVVLFTAVEMGRGGCPDKVWRKVGLRYENHRVLNQFVRE